MHRVSRLGSLVLLISTFSLGCGGDLSTAERQEDASLAGVYGGQCSATFPSIAPRGWRHPLQAAFTLLQGAPNHRVRDLIVLPGEAAALRARFTYGAVDKDLEDETVDLYIQRCPNWEYQGSFTTNDDGIVYAKLSGTLPAGDYRVRFVVRGDTSTADGMVAVWRPGVQAIVSDIDGTLTTSDAQAWKDVLTGQSAAAYPDSNRALSRWVQKGYRVIYLTGRPQYINRYTHTWLDKNGYPRGPVHLTEEGQELLPTDSGVRAFKADWMRTQQTHEALRITAVYGNATTDIGAYADVGIAKAATYIIGPYAGQGGTVGLSSYTQHLPAIDTYPNALQP